MSDYKVQYIIGLKDSIHNYYVVTDMESITEKSLVLVSESQYLPISKLHLYPYNTFKISKVIPSGFEWVVLKMIVNIKDKESKFQVDDAWIKDTKARLIEEIFYSIAFANTFVKRIYEDGEKETASEIRKRVLTEQAYFSKLTSGCISSYEKLLNNEELAAMDNTKYKFPLTICNIERLDDLLNRDILIDYSILVSPGRFGRYQSFISNVEISKLSANALVTLFSNIPFEMMDWDGEYFNNDEFILAAFKKMNRELLNYLLDWAKSYEDSKSEDDLLEIS